MKLISLVGVLILIKLSKSSDDYYWRDFHPDFTSRIPDDAIPGGRDIADKDIYIGQANIWGVSGVHPCTIPQGIGQDVWVHAGGAKKATKFVQILCSPHPGNFKWIPATSTTLHVVGMNTHIVSGGYDIDRVVYIGRAKHQGNVIIGKVFTHDINNSEMVFIFQNHEYRVKSYEILTYDMKELSKLPNSFDFIKR